MGGCGCVGFAIIRCCNKGFTYRRMLELLTCVVSSHLVPCLNMGLFFEHRFVLTPHLTRFVRSGLHCCLFCHVYRVGGWVYVCVCLSVWLWVCL